MREYLLGGLSAQERDAVEARLMSDSEYYDRLAAAEDDLVDLYVRGTLAENERRRFEERFLATEEGRRDVRFARALERRLAGGAVSRGAARAWPRTWMLAAAALAVALGGAMLALELRRLRGELDEVRRRQAETLGSERERAERLAAELERERSLHVEAERELAARRGPTSAGAAPLAVFTLVPGLVRDLAGVQRLVLPAGRGEVELRLDAGDARYGSHAAVIATAEGKEVWRATGLAASAGAAGQVVAVRLQARVLPAGDYMLSLTGRIAGREPEPVATYHFRVAPR